jgi:ribosomal protein S18 acetylase RimI-like enzyme
MGIMQIVDFQPAHAAAFRALNEAWITRLFALEPKDVAVLGDPAGKIIAPGGHIFMATEDGAAIGCVALMAMADAGSLEVAKMAVAEAHKGRGIGGALMAACVARGREIGARRLYLETNSGLAPALGLYRRFGFQVVEPAEPSPYARADVVMELWL